MLIAFSQIDGTKLAGTDDSLGTLKDAYFDDTDWNIRYLIADTGSWLPGRKVLVSPAALIAHDWGTHSARSRLTKTQIENGPDVDLMRSVSRQMELEMVQHYEYPIYWGGGVGVGGGGAAAMPPSAFVPDEEQREIEAGLPNLRSAHEVTGYYIKASDGDIGHVEELIIDDQDWIVRYIAIDTKNWLPGRKVLVSPNWIESISWTDQTVQVDLTCEAIKGSPEYDPLQPVNRDYEQHLFDYYGREQYWL